jgi:hypothetical protein
MPQSKNILLFDLLLWASVVILLFFVALRLGEK